MIDKQKLAKAVKEKKVTDKKSLAAFVQNEEFLQEVDNRISDIASKVEEAVKEVKNSELDLPSVLANIRGAKGDQGEKGDQGDQGPQGEKGDQGIQGKKGEKGETGLQGVQGLPGNDGLDGNNGTDGKDGSPDTRLQIVEKINSGTIKDLKILGIQIENFDKLVTSERLERAISILDQRTQFLINKQTGTISNAVTSLNGLTGAVTLVAGSNITLTPSGNNITIASAGGSSTLNATQVGFGSGSNLLTGSSLFTWDGNNLVLDENNGATNTIFIKGDQSPTAQLKLGAHGRTTPGAIYSFESVGGSAGDSVFYTSATDNVTPTEKMRLTSWGALGIGVTPPNAYGIGLMVNTFSSTGNLGVGGPVSFGSGITLSSVNNAFNTNELLEVRATQTSFSIGNVGIGTATITHMLEVNGTGNISGQFTSSGLNYPTADASSGYVVTTDGAGNLSLQAPGAASIAIGSAITSSTPGSVLFVDSSNQLAQDNASFFWDDTNKVLEIATTNLSPIDHIQLYSGAISNNSNLKSIRWIDNFAGHIGDTIGAIGMRYNGSSSYGEFVVHSLWKSSASTDINFSVDGLGVARIPNALGILETGSSPQYYTYFTGGDQGADITYTLPTAVAGGNGYFLSSTTGGVLSWVAAPAPALTATYVGFGDGSNLLTGSANFTWNGSLVHLTNPGSASASGQTVLTLDALASSAGAVGSGPQLDFASSSNGYNPMSRIASTVNNDGSGNLVFSHYVYGVGLSPTLVLNGDGGSADIANLNFTKIGGTSPAADNTYANPTSITIKNGVITAIS